jgi:uncharacterized membrane-anchored protein YhcB (DUF1043 family)
MEHDPNIFRDSSRVIQEVEEQLEHILQKRFRDVDSELVERINREKEEARKRKEEIEREFDKEKSALNDYRAMVREFEEQRAGLLNEARERFQKVLDFQSQIESLAKSTVDEIKRVNEIQEGLEALRTKTSERAAFLKNDLKERFGIVAEVMEEESKPLDLDLDEELEKLRKIKELLAIESAAASLGRLDGQAESGSELTEMEAGADQAGPSIPEISDLIAGTPSSDRQEPKAETGAEPAAAAEIEPEPEPAEAAGASSESDEDPSEDEIAAELESYRHTEPANGSGEIHFFQKGDVAVADAEKLLEAVERTLDEGQRLSVRLGVTESPKDQFFIKQELINWQEGLRALFLRVVKMCEKEAWSLPRYTEEIVNPQILRRLLERLSMENWSNLDEFASFASTVAELRAAFRARIEPRRAYLLSLRKQIEEA